jgi:hypothetical protein
MVPCRVLAKFRSGLRSPETPVSTLPYFLEKQRRTSTFLLCIGVLLEVAEFFVRRPASPTVRTDRYGKVARTLFLLTVSIDAVRRNVSAKDEGGLLPPMEGRTSEVHSRKAAFIS